MPGIPHIALMLIANAVGIAMVSEHENNVPLVLLSLFAIADGYALEYFSLMNNLYA